jgi:2-haloacid dehalogenase
MAHPSTEVKAMLFDTFGTVVDWRGSLIRELSQFGAARRVSADWAVFADRWRGQYQPQMERVRSGARSWVKLDELHREVLDTLLLEFGLSALDDSQRRHLNKVWHRLDPWPDAVEGLTRLKRRNIIGPLSNGNVALLTDLAKHARLPWDVILSTELHRCYKPQPEAYLGACALLDLAPGEVMMCAAHNDDLRAARALGMKTAFFPRPSEHGPGQRLDLAATEAWDVVAADIVDLADRMGA